MLDNGSSIEPSPLSIHSSNRKLVTPISMIDEDI
jgi:hypothetical protein